MKEFTLLSLESEINRWLKVKWEHADYHRELPNQSAALCRMKEIFEKELKDCVWHGGTLASCREKFAVIVNQDIDTLTLLDADRLTEGDKSDFRIITWINGIATPIASFAITTKYFEDEDDKCLAVKSIKCLSSEDMNIEQILLRAACLQSESKLDHLHRWLATPEEYRREHPVCPSCGGAIYLSRCDNSGANNMVCESCNWVSHHKYYYTTEYVEEKMVMKEYRRIQKENITQQAVNEMEGNIQQCLDVLKEINHNTGKYLFSNEQYLQTLARLKSKIEKIITETSSSKK